LVGNGKLSRKRGIRENRHRDTADVFGTRAQPFLVWIEWPF
jgi:hypothetical protein